MRLALNCCKLAVVLSVIALSARTHAATTITNFDFFDLGGTYAEWANPFITTLDSGPTSYTITSTGFGGGPADINPNIDASGNTHVAFDVTVNFGDDPNILVLLSDDDGTEYLYRWYEVTPGNHLLTAALFPIGSGVPGQDSFQGNAGGVPGLDLSTISFIHLQVDPHGSPVQYSISYNDLSLYAVPEPTSLGLLAMCGAMIGLRRSR